MNDIMIASGLQKDGQQIDVNLENLIKSNLENANKLSLWALDSYSVLTAVSARADDLEKQGILGRFWGSVTGQNRKMSIHNQQDLAHAQMLAQEMLVKLSEQNAISFEMALSLRDKLSLLEQDFADAKVKINDAFGKTQEQIKGIYQNLNQFFDKVKSKIEELEAEFRRNDDLLFWKETLLEHKVYNGLYYEDMNHAQKILCMVQEFFTVTKGHWNSRDISFLRSSLRSVGITPDMPIKPLELVQQVQNDPALLEHLVSKTNFAAEFSGLTIDMPMLASLKQTIDVKGGEKHIIDTIAGFSPDANVEDIENAYITNTVLSKFGRSLEKEHKAFDVAVDILGDLLLTNLRSEQAENLFVSHSNKVEISLVENKSFNYANASNPFNSSRLHSIYVRESQFVKKGKVLASLILGLNKELFFVVAQDDFTILKILVEEGGYCSGSIFEIDKDVKNQGAVFCSAESYFSINKGNLKSIKLSDLSVTYFDDELDSIKFLHGTVMNNTLEAGVGEFLDLDILGVAECPNGKYSSVSACISDNKYVVLSFNTDLSSFSVNDQICKVVKIKDFFKAVSNV